MADYIKYLPVDNGDSILIKSGYKSVLTDIKYRTSDDDVYDIFDDIKDACSDNKLSLYVSTHQDQDHVLGFSDVFHCGTPVNWKNDGNTLLVCEIACSERALTEDKTDQSRAILNEIRRRNRLIGTVDADKDGNRLKVVKEGDNLSMGTKLKGKVLAPNGEEADGESRNNSSVVVRWIYSGDKNSTKILLGGDAECEVWERLDTDYKAEDLDWHLCTAPHHCSLTPLAKKEDKTDKNSDYVDNDKAINALNHPLGKAFVVSSSKKIKRDDDNPPHYKAKNKWISILKTSETDESKERFFCTAEHEEKTAPVVFTLNDNGITLEKKSKSNNATKATAVNKPTTYG
ncbi:hypothetical protein VHA01S_019_00560 [Vibrio halioticoli NBRC 102217]|uniref:Metallo-beta-lactamase domain-containing protein n=1 Tax=Vibrio halioticoli NBRC 102217 TaxID=1219072 RepID=V5F2N8_9VIBR|nr:hypothetical protein [Vibrio halioticoli]GAD89379.1 hypothetical protein VHA01S_019_00560 [Vibrio halioticoli NBRC 102217]